MSRPRVPAAVRFSAPRGVAVRRSAVAGADGGRQRIQLGQRLGIQFDGRAAQVLLEVPRPLGARDGQDMLALGEHPGDADLRRCRAQALGDAPDAVDDARRSRPSRPAGSAGWWRGSRRSGNPWSGRSAPVRKPRPRTPKATKDDAVGGAPRDHVLSGSRVHSENSLCSALTGCVAWARASSSTVHSDIPSRRILPSARAPRACRSSPRPARPGPRGAGSRGRARRCPRRSSEPSHCRRIVSGWPSRTVLRRGKPRFSRPHLEAISDLGGPIAQRAADELLVVAAAVQRRRVEMRHAELDRALERALGDGVLLRIEVVAPGCAHAAEPDRRDGRAVGAECALRQARHARTLCRTPLRMRGSMYRTLRREIQWVISASRKF